MGKVIKISNKREFGGNAPNKLRPMLKVGGVSMRATHAVGMAKSLSDQYKTAGF